MTAKKRATPSTWADPDDAPELTDRFFENADLIEGDRMIKRGRGRPRGTTKTPATVRFDDDVLAAMRASGPRWQTRLNALVRNWLKRKKFDEIKA